MKKALIFWGGWDGHEPNETSALAEAMLCKEGFEVARVNSTDCLLDGDALMGYDLIVPAMTMGVLGDEETRNLCKAVAAGAGLGGWHGGMGDAFRGNTEYQFMVGGQFVAHPGNMIDYVVEVVCPGDPIMAGIGNFKMHSEQYYMHVDPSNRVLATTTFSGDHCPWVAGTVMPTIWTRPYGAGRVFYSALGHCAGEFAVPELAEILRRGLLWAAR